MIICPASRGFFLYNTLLFNKMSTTFTWSVATLELVKTALGGEEKVTEIEAALQAQLDEQRTPTKASGKPWS